MKKTLFAILIVLIPAIFIAQSVEADDPTFIKTGTLSEADDWEIEVHWDIINTSTDLVNISCKREVIEEVAGSRNKFCWGPLCYGYDTDVSPDGTEVQMIPNGVNDTFHGYYEHQENSGCTAIKYCFFNINDESDEACIITRFEVDGQCADDVSITENKIESELNNVSPNPVVGLSTFSYKIAGNVNNSKVVFFNMVGAIVKEVNLTSNQGVVLVDGNDFETGVYFFSLVVDGNSTSTKRMVVTR